ncbi:alpha/beta hydrolase [Candidatus Gottesmanbacteria bacterium]|nr:alpha/beta hydrolase [Candidatus Gottesmanbacteria bacterium]
MAYIHKFYSSHPLKTIIIHNKNWEYIVCGRGIGTLLLFPGGGQTAQSNFQLIDAFKNKYKVISPTIYDVDSIDEFCYAINKILEKENSSKVIIYGLSIGGMMAQSYVRRNKDNVIKLIISHAPAPKSKTYKEKIIRPITFLNTILPFIPNYFIQFMSKRFAGWFQGVSRKDHLRLKPEINKVTEELQTYFIGEFYKKYFNKKLLKTWIKLHLNFYNNENFLPDDLSDWKGEILILRTDNDPLAQDDGEFKRLYPKAHVYTFHNTGHLTFYYQFENMVEVMRKFLGDIH